MRSALDVARYLDNGIHEQLCVERFAQVGVGTGRDALIPRVGFVVCGDDDRRHARFQVHQLPQDVHPGAAILLDDGKIELRVLRMTDQDVETVIITGGTLSASKGINVPGVTLSVSSLTERDIEYLRFGLKQGVDIGIVFDEYNLFHGFTAAYRIARRLLQNG